MGCGGLIVLAAAILIGLNGGGFLNLFGAGSRGGAGGGPTPTPTPTARSTPIATPIATPTPTPGPGTTVPTISARTYSAGNAPVTVTGAFTFGSTLALLPQDAFSDGVETTLNYGYHLDPGGMLLTFTQRTGADGLGLNVNSGPWLATYVGEGCTWEIEVTDETLSGHISCTGIPAANEADGSTGTVDVELDFSADSPPGD